MDIIFEFFADKPWFHWVTAVVAAASAFAAISPTPEKGSTLAKIYAVIDLLAINIGKAKDKSEKK